jgi:homocitrate synthase NifV
VSKASQRPLPDWKPVVGRRVFSHESGLHADGVLKNPANYEGFDPAEVGLHRRLVVGKHSGRSVIMDRFGEMGVKIDSAEALLIMSEVRNTAQRLKRPLNNFELLKLYESVKSSKAA